MKLKIRVAVLLCIAGCVGVQALLHPARAQNAGAPSGPDPKEIPVPRIKTPIGTLPGVGQLPVRTEMPDVLAMNNGTKVTNPKQWEKRRDEMKRILAYYAVGQMPPPP